MDLRIDLGYEQILQLVRQLPFQEKQRLTHDIEQELRVVQQEQQQKPEDSELTEFQRLLLTGPVMSDEQFKQFEELRKGFTAWINN